MPLARLPGKAHVERPRYRDSFDCRSYLQRKRYVVRKNALLVIIAVCAWLAVGLFATGCTIGDTSSLPPAPTARDQALAKPPKSDPDSDAFKKIAVKACMDSATKEGVPENVSIDYCNCAIDELVQRLTSDQIAEIAHSGHIDLPPDVEEQLSSAVLDCMDKLLK
jgi:hypothetical protein